MNTAILNKSLVMFFALLMISATPLMAQVYKVVDKDGNVTYTDQPPADGSCWKLAGETVGICQSCVRGWIAGVHSD